MNTGPRPGNLQRNYIIGIVMTRNTNHYFRHFGTGQGSPGARCDKAYMITMTRGDGQAFRHLYLAHSAAIEAVWRAEAHGQCGWIASGFVRAGCGVA